jgi:hypothetical protein
MLGEPHLITHYLCILKTTKNTKGHKGKMRTHFFSLCSFVLNSHFHPFAPQAGLNHAYDLAGLINLNLNFKPIKSSKRVSPYLRLPVCRRFEVAVEVEVEKPPLHGIPDLRFTGMRRRRD